MSRLVSYTLLSSSEKTTRRMGEALGKISGPGSVIALEGNLGSGKTVFVQGLARGLGIKNPEEIRSPTFVLIQEHLGKIPLCHADLYRLSSAEIKNLGLEEYWRSDTSRPETGWVVAIEWADKAGGLISEQLHSDNFMKIEFEFTSATKRMITFSGTDLCKKFQKQWKKSLP